MLRHFFLILPSFFFLVPSALDAHGSHEEPSAVTGSAHEESLSDTLEEYENTDDELNKDPWDVNDPPGPKKTVSINVSEGTWISLDVSPDGRFIVFDLLGDVYRIPIAGGRAEPLTSGIAWDMQPRYSPDGKSIAFTSDRGGGFNIWVTDSEGKHVRQITEENYRLVNNPVWTPDGQAVAVRKHFTSRRSLGAGEIWLYHIDGGKGIQMIARPNDQKDLGEPAFSPDGRYLYFSQDVTPGNVFEYNKNVNVGIYAIKRQDRHNGDVEVILSGPGGAVRPTPSPDGRYLAFVRRIRSKSMLFLHEIASNTQRALFDQMERDMQETWAIHGVYPNMAWTPDSRSIVFWAQGGIHRIDIGSGEVAEIPFQVTTTREVQEPLRFPQEVCPESFDVKMLRWTTVSPDGNKVVFQALGRLYIRDLPEGRSRPLTDQTDDVEMYPAFSRDGRFIAYTTWNDDRLGAVRILSLEDSSTRVIADRPGHYVEPAFSPDRSQVVYRRVGKHMLRSGAWTNDSGVYLVDLKTRKTELLSKRGRNPHFGATGDTIYLQAGSSQKQQLVGIDLRTGRETVYFSSKNATEFHVSPDERRLSFVERFNVFVCPFVRSGQPVEIGPKIDSLPIRKVSRDAGLYLQWSGDSGRLHWSLGPELYSLNIADLPHQQADPSQVTESAENQNIQSDSLIEPQRTMIGFSHPSHVPTGNLALIGGRLITMRGTEVIENGMILIKDNRISYVGPAGSREVPVDAHVINVNGSTILPGLIDVHAHGPHGGHGIVPQRNWINYATLAFGVTTIHDPSNDTETIFASSELAKAGLITAPRIFSTGRILYGASGSARAEVDSLEDARFHIRRMKAVGAFTVKSYNQPRREQRQQIVQAAREMEIMVVPEGGSLFHPDMTMIIDGHTGIEHNIPVPRAYDDVLQLWAATEVGYTPTLVVCFGGLGGQFYWYQHTNVWEHERLNRFVPREIIDPPAIRRPMAPDSEYNHIINAGICKALIDVGGRVQLGAHGEMAGLAAHWELWMFVQGGMTPWEALRSATRHGAYYIGLDGEIGILEAGKLADLIVLEKNPLEDIRHSESVIYTVLNGQVYDAHTMNRLYPESIESGRFFWERDYSILPRKIPAKIHVE